jgi:hypothetical protein
MPWRVRDLDRWPGYSHLPNNVATFRSKTADQVRGRYTHVQDNRLSGTAA